MLLAIAAQAAPAANPAAPTSAFRSFNFGGTTYVHRWSQNGQNEFTPPNDADLARWRDLVTINVHENVRSGDDLAALANRHPSALPLRGRGSLVQFVAKQ
jgi:hypothetical protein